MTETHPKISDGTDVGKSRLELSINAAPTRIYANDPEGIAALTLALPRPPNPLPWRFTNPPAAASALLATMLAEAGVPACRYIPIRRSPTPGPAASSSKPTNWTPRPCPPTRPPKPAIAMPDGVPS